MFGVDNLVIFALGVGLGFGVKPALSWVKAKLAKKK